MGFSRRDLLKSAAAAIVQLGFLPRVVRAAEGDPGTGTSGTVHAGSVTVSSDALPRDLAALVAGFSTPPDSDKVGGYWWWFNTLMDKAGITRDMEEFKAKGIMEVLLVNSAAGLGTLPMPSGPDFLSDEWMELYTFALDEAKRNGIKVGFNLCAGWCMGGPWIESRESGRWFLQSRKQVTGPISFSEKLPLPGNRDGYNDVKNPPGVNDYIDLPLEKLDYRDTAVTAIKLPPGGGAEIDGKRKELLPAKSNRMDASNWTRATVIMEKPLEDFPTQPDDKPIPLKSVVDLTGKMTADGHLDWEVPEGDWVIVRTGHRMTGSKVYLGLPGGDGLSIDWLNRSGTEKQFQVMGQKLLKAAKEHIGDTLVYFADDSFEDGFPNWTENILEQFMKYRGYDATPYLPVLAGYLVGSAEISDRFMYDYRRTVADLLADEHYKRFQDLCHESGLKVQNESAGPSRSGTMCMDTLKNLGRTDLPSGEFWLGQRYGMPDEEDWKLGYGQTRLEDGQNKVTKMVASGAHIYGKNLVAAEAFTSTKRTHWLDHPATMRYAADRAFCEGVNRIMIHTTTGSRPQDGKPGYEYGAGTHFNPNVTWWDQAGAFLTYMARCQHLLRMGLFVADVLYYNGDWAPNIVPAKHTDPGLGKGYDYDVCNEEVLLTRLAVKGGRIVLPDGMSYRILVLPETDHMPVRVAEKLKELVTAGATVIGPKPVQDPGLKDYPKCDEAVKLLAAEIWGDADGKSVTSRKLGAGTVYWGVTPREVLAKLGAKPDVDFVQPDAYMDFIHRSAESAEIYFLLNRKKERQQMDVKFRVTGRQPYLFEAVTGKSRALSGAKEEGGLTTLNLVFEPREAYFVVFPKDKLPDAPKEAGPNFFTYAPVQTLEGPWKVQFAPQWGGPTESVEFPLLTDWTTHSDERIKYFSGTALYTKTFDAPAAAEGELAIDLGTVHNIADVKLNGKDLGTIWTNPWRVDVADLLKSTGNVLEIRVTNMWPNRLIKDAALPKDQRLTNTNVEVKPTDKLLESGLLGPVTVVRRV